MQLAAGDPATVRVCAQRGGELMRLGPQGFLEPEVLELAIVGSGGPVGGAGAQAGRIHPGRASHRWDTRAWGGVWSARGGAGAGHPLLRDHSCTQTALMWETEKERKRILFRLRSA